MYSATQVEANFMKVFGDLGWRAQKETGGGILLLLGGAGVPWKNLITDIPILMLLGFSMEHQKSNGTPNDQM